MALNEGANFAEKQRYFIGSAKIHLKHFDFGVHSTSLTLDTKNIDRLIQVFKLEGCLRLDLEHHIPAIISNQTLQESLARSAVDGTELHRQQSPPTLLFPEGTYLPCLHGKHRIAAAKTLLLPGNTWWTVDLYLDELGEHVRRDIREEYANSRNFCDGDIFQQIRYCQQSLDHQGEGRWLARLTEAKRKDLKQLQRRIELRPLVEGLDDLLPFVGLWPSLQIGTFHRLLNLKCPEELQRYLMHVHWCWDYILNQDQSLRPLVDVETVRLLETLNPRASIRDENTIELWMIQGKLFPRVVDPLVRKRILDRLKQFDRMIPSLHTFLEDTKWLEPCVKIIRSLLPPGCRDPTRESIFKMYNGSNILRVQDSSMIFTEYEGSEVRNVEYGYRQLWLFAWRHFPELSGMMPRKDKGEPKPQPKASNEQCRYQFAQLASTLGFQSSIITAVQERDPDTVMALDFLREARPEEFFRLQERVRSTLAGLICQVLPSVGAKNAITRERLDIMQDVLIPTDHRCGRPHEQSHSYSKSYFFLEDIYAERTQRLSYYTVNRDIFLAFFGTMPPWKPSNDEMDQDSEPQLNSRVNLADRMDTNLQVNNSFAGPSVTSTSLSQSRTLNTNPVVPVLAVEPVMSTNDTILQHNEPASTPFPQIGPADTSSLALVPAVTTREQGVEQYRAPGGKFIRQIGAVNEIVDGSDMGSQLVPREATEKPTLYATWKSQCKNGDKFLVEASNLAYLNVHSGESTPLDALKMFSSCCALAWSPYKNQLVSVTPEALDRYACSTTADGIIYFFERMTSDRRLKLITGETTERRLHQLEETLPLTEPLAEPPEAEL